MRGCDDCSKSPQWTHCTLEALVAGDCARTILYSDAAAQDALYNSSIIDCDNFWMHCIQVVILCVMIYVNVLQCVKY